VGISKHVQEKKNCEIPVMQQSGFELDTCRATCHYHKVLPAFTKQYHQLGGGVGVNETPAVLRTTELSNSLKSGKCVKQLFLLNGQNGNLCHVPKVKLFLCLINLASRP
jgi:hypothetical protein